MNPQQHRNRDDMNVWLSQAEVAKLLEAAIDTQQRLAYSSGARCGLRSREILDVSPEDVVDTDAGTVLRVWQGKRDKFRETPVPRELATTIRTVADVRDASSEKPLLEMSTTRSLQRWLSGTARELHQVTGDDGWLHLGMHDCRRTWATALAAAEIDSADRSRRTDSSHRRRALEARETSLCWYR